MLGGELKGSHKDVQSFDSWKTQQCTQTARYKYGKSLEGGTRRHSPGPSL